MSPAINMGTIRPVDLLAPKAKAIKVTMIMAIPFIPDLETPITKAAVKAISQDTIVMLISEGSSICDNLDKQGQMYLKKFYL